MASVWRFAFLDVSSVAALRSPRSERSGAAYEDVDVLKVARLGTFGVGGGGVERSTTADRLVEESGAKEPVVLERSPKVSRTASTDGARWLDRERNVSSIILCAISFS